jgi:HPr kinase/phosphorylase
LSGKGAIVHGTCVAFGTKAALLRGGSGSGKSDLALRFLSLPAEGELRPLLVADDQVVVEPDGAAGLVVSPPAALAGKIEVRGLGIAQVPYIREAALVLAVDLVPLEDVPRMPDETPERINIAGESVPLLRLSAFEASAPLKLKLALLATSR